MEELFESIVGIVVVIFFIVRKFMKSEEAKKKKEAPKPAPKMPAEAFETPVKVKPIVDAKAAAKLATGVLKEIMEIEIDEADEDEEEAPAMEQASVPVITPVPAAPVPAVSVMSVEGDCPHPEHVPVEYHAELKALAPEKPKPVVEEKSVTAAVTANRRFDAAAMRRAVVTAEILNRPVALRKQAR